MSSNILQIAWSQIRGDVKTYFTYLTDSDLDEIAGDDQKLIAKLQERYGYSTEQARIEWDQFMRRFDNLTHEPPAESGKKVSGSKPSRKSKM